MALAGVAWTHHFFAAPLVLASRYNSLQAFQSSQPFFLSLKAHLEVQIPVDVKPGWDREFWFH